MKELIGSLSLGSGAVVVAILSLVISLGIGRLRFKKIKWLLALTMPFIIANVIYWYPVMLGADSSEYSIWAPLFIISWYLAGSLASALSVVVINRRQLNENKKRG
jgi:hypothetical protein